MGRYYNGDINGQFWFGVQSSDDGKYFGMEEESIYEDGEISYYSDDLDAAKEGVTKCKNNLGIFKEKMDRFFNKRDGYSDRQLSEWLIKDIGNLGILGLPQRSSDVLASDFTCSEKKIRKLLRWYARLELGNKILQTIISQGDCQYEAEC